MSANNPVPGRQSLLPYLLVRDARAALGFYAATFGARERVRMELPDGRIGHAEIEEAQAVAPAREARR